MSRTKFHNILGELDGHNRIFYIWLSACLIKILPINLGLTDGSNRPLQLVNFKVYDNERVEL